MAEIDDKLLAEYQGAYKIASALFANPKTKHIVQGAIKEIAPNAPLPEFEIRKDVDDRLAKMQATLDEFVKKTSAERETSEFQGKWDAAMRKYGITEDGQEKVLKLATERKIADPEAAALLFNAQNPPAEPLTSSSPWAASTLFDVSPDAELGEWFKNPDKKRDEEIGKVFSERNR